MHNSHFFLKHLSRSLEQKILGWRIVSCFSQNKNELILEFNNGNASVFIKTSLQAEINCLSFPDKLTRSKKNSVDLFSDTLLKSVTGVHPFENERCFAILLENNFQLVFKMFGNHSNVLLMYHQQVKDVFRKKLASDLTIQWNQLDRPIDWSQNYFLKNKKDLKSAYPTLGNLVWAYLQEQGFTTLSDEDKWILFANTLAKLNNPTYYILKQDDRFFLSLLPLYTIVDSFDDPLAAVTQFFSQWTYHHELTKIRSTHTRKANQHIKQCKNYLTKNRSRLHLLTTENHYQLWADLIMANLHHIKGGSKAVQFPNFTDAREIEIKLKLNLSPQQNAASFYQKSKNLQKEIEKLKEGIKQKEEEIEFWEEQIRIIGNETDLKKIKQLLSSSTTSKEQAGPVKPYHEFEHLGFKIWVGKNATSNDQLTLKYAHKDDLWLHAKDVAGSHTIIKYQSGKSFPKQVIERAAELAAFNSKRKTETLCPVIYTPKKFVRKRKGDPPGAVIVEREKVIMVEPRL